MEAFLVADDRDVRLLFDHPEKFRFVADWPFSALFQLKLVPVARANCWSAGQAKTPLSFTYLSSVLSITGTSSAKEARAALSVGMIMLFSAR